MSTDMSENHNTAFIFRVEEEAKQETSKMLIDIQLNTQHYISEDMTIFMFLFWWLVFRDKLQS
jgi:hypothetical protein